MHAIDTAEIAHLEQSFGPLPRWPACLSLDQANREFWWRQLDSNRRAEVVLILPRPRQSVVLITKPNYPPGTFRLPTGGIGPEEPVLAAANREAVEETGLHLDPPRIVGLVDWTFCFQHETRGFASYLCLFAQSSEPLTVIDPHERISEYREFPLADLDQIAGQLAHLDDGWQNWGMLRAIPHQRALEALQPGLAPGIFDKLGKQC